jgi:hypothetical protein
MDEPSRYVGRVLRFVSHVFVSVWFGVYVRGSIVYEI